MATLLLALCDNFPPSSCRLALRHAAFPPPHDQPPSRFGAREEGGGAAVANRRRERRSDGGGGGAGAAVKRAPGGGAGELSPAPVVAVREAGGLGRVGCSLPPRAAMAGALARKAVDYVRSKEFRDYLMR